MVKNQTLCTVIGLLSQRIPLLSVKKSLLDKTYNFCLEIVTLKMNSLEQNLQGQPQENLSSTTSHQKIKKIKNPNVYLVKEL